MFFYEGLTCPVCSRSFHPNEDVVSCPHCGLPHHRACWEKAGHCHLEHLHNTSEQWSRDNAVKAKAIENDTPVAPVRRCPQCATENPEFAEFCKRCGRPISQPHWESAPGSAHEYKPFTAVQEDAADNERIDGISAKDYAAVVGQRADYYLPRFKQLSRTKAGGWNWAAFLLGPYWLLYRKMYLYGGVMLTLQLVEFFITEYVFRKLSITNYQDMYTAFAGAADNRATALYLLSIWLISAIILLLRVVIGATGNRLYKNHCTAAIRKAREKVPDLSAAELATTGGTSLGIALIGYCALSVLSQMTTLLFM